MTEAEVRAVLGKPHEIRPYGPPSAPTGFVYAYGAEKRGGFATIGIVRFGPDLRVIEAVSPARGYGSRPGLQVLSPDLDRPTPVSNVLCVIQGVTDDPSVPDYQVRQHLQFTLTNQGSAPVFIPTPLRSLGQCVAVEVFEDNRRLFFRSDHGSRGPIFLDPSSGYPGVSLKPGESMTGSASVWLSSLPFGKPPPGRYFVRAAFPLVPVGQDNMFTVSKAVEFTVRP